MKRKINREQFNELKKNNFEIKTNDFKLINRTYPIDAVVRYCYDERHHVRGSSESESVLFHSESEMFAHVTEKLMELKRPNESQYRKINKARIDIEWKYGTIQVYVKRTSTHFSIECNHEFRWAEYPDPISDWTIYNGQWNVYITYKFRKKIKITEVI